MNIFIATILITTTIICGQQLKCYPERLVNCDRNECKVKLSSDSNFNQIHIEFDLKNKIYKRVDNSTNTFKNVEFEAGLVWLVARPTISNVFKINMENMEYIETLSMGDVTWNYWGNCTTK